MRTKYWYRARKIKFFNPVCNSGYMFRIYDFPVRPTNMTTEGGGEVKRPFLPPPILNSNLDKKSVVWKKKQQNSASKMSRKSSIIVVSEIKLLYFNNDFNNEVSLCPFRFTFNSNSRKSLNENQEISNSRKRSVFNWKYVCEKNRKWDIDLNGSALESWDLVLSNARGKTSGGLTQRVKFSESSVTMLMPPAKRKFLSVLFLVLPYMNNL